MEKAISVKVKICIFFLIKYIFFYIFLMFKNNNFKLLEWHNLKSGASITYFILMMSVPIILCIMICSIPLYWALRSNNIVIFPFLIFLVFSLEYFVYVFMTSQKYFYDPNGIYNIIISLIFFIIFFHNNINVIKSK